MPIAEEDVWERAAYLQGKSPLLALGQGADEAGAGDGILPEPLAIHALIDA